MSIWKVIARPFLRPVDQAGEATLESLLDRNRIPRHVAVIMDGNGRWAKKRMLPRVAGHRIGIDSVRDTVRNCSVLGVSHLTLFAFSTENWARPTDEVNALMSLIEEYIVREIDELHANGVRFQMIGQKEALPRSVLRGLENAAEKTHENSGLHFNVAVSYSGRSELEQAFQKIAAKVAAGSLAAGEVDEELLSFHLYTAGQPAPELLIRTSGEKRISNFLLWQIPNAEIYFTETLWPDFRKKALLKALLHYQKRTPEVAGDRLACQLDEETTRVPAVIPTDHDGAQPQE